MENTENKFKHDGLWYIAVDGDLSCRGCAFINDANKCIETPPCYQEGRQDNRNVIFVRSDVGNLGDGESIAPA